MTLSELDGGERVVSERVSGVRSVSLGFWIDVGSRDERDDRAGVSHFIEHLLFKGSRRFDAQTIAETFDAMGAELNAATSRENTVVFARVPDHHVETALDVMADMVFAPAFAEVDQEREVVLEEIAMYEDTPQELVHDLFSQAVFGDHPLGPAGDRHGGGHLDRQPPRALVLSPHRVRAGERRRRGRGEPRARPPRRAAPAERAPRGRSGARRHARPPAARARCRSPSSASSARRPSSTTSASARRASRAPIAAASPPRSSTRSSAARRRRGLFQEIREKRGMAYSVYSFAAQYTDTGVIGVYVGTREENLGACIEICVEQIGEIAAGRLRKGELERAKESLKGRIVLSLESTSNRMSRLGKSLITDTELMTLERVMAEIDAVDADELAELAAVLLPSERLAAAGVGPDEDKFRAAVGRASTALVESAAA